MTKKEEETVQKGRKTETKKNGEIGTKHEEETIN